MQPIVGCRGFYLFPPLISTVFFLLLDDAQQLSLSDPIDVKIADISLPPPFS